MRFQELQHAYAVLSNAHERKWYDDHRDEILNPARYEGDGDSDDGAGGRTVNVTPFFRCSSDVFAFKNRGSHEIPHSLWAELSKPRVLHDEENATAVERCVLGTQLRGSNTAVGIVAASARDC